MANCHRNNDQRSDGAITIVSGQNFVKVNGQLWAVDGDMDSAGEGALISTHSWLNIGGKGVIVVGDSANPDIITSNPSASTGDGTVTVS